MKNILTREELNEKTTTGALDPHAGYQMSPQGTTSKKDDDIDITQHRYAWAKANAKAKSYFGESGLATCSEEDMNKIIDLRKANALAKKKFGEFGFATCKEDEMKELVDENPTLLRT